jgi:predicted deacetylase
MKRPSNPSVLISIHDVHSGNYLEVEALLRLFPLEVRPKVALMMVPQHFSHFSEGPLNRDLPPALFPKQEHFSSWLQEKEQQGHELFLHGLYHKTREAVFKQNRRAHVPKGGRNRWGKLVNAWLVDHEAEFAGLSKERMELEVTEAVEESLNALNKKPVGWVFPTWHGKLPLELLKKVGIHYTESRWYVYNLAQSKTQKPLRFISLAVSWPRSWFWIWIGEKVFAVLSPFFINVRFVLHPGDQDSPTVGRYLQRIIAKRRSVQYRELF